MINSALEAGIDVATTSFDPLAKLAKDIAAGAVLIATVNAVAVGYLVFSDQVFNRSSRVIERLRDAPAELTLIALVLTIILVLATKAYHGRGTPLRGALLRARGGCVRRLDGGDAGRRRLAALVPDLVAHALMAILVAQTRLEAGVTRSSRSLRRGLGSLAVLVMFQVFG